MAAPGEWVPIGPTRIDDGSLGSIGRIHFIAVHPTTPTTIYVGGPACGIWKTSDGGASWAPVGDSLPNLIVAALAIDPVSPSRVYAVLEGAGIFRSDDSAGSWTQIAGDLGTPKGAGLLVVDPRTPSRLFVTAAGNGLFRSTDSGATWTRVKNGPVTDFIMDPSNPDVLYAGVMGDGVYKTRTGGADGEAGWNKLPGLPASGFTRVTLALCAATPTTVYAGLSGSPFRLFRATDGATFALRFRAASSIYNPWLGADPVDPAIVYVPSADFRRSTDGGATVTVTSNDLHECQKIVTDPVTPGMIYLGRDNGLFRSADHGVSFTQIGGGIANVEFYDGTLAATDPAVRIGGTQDNGTLKSKSGSLVWKRFQGGDGATVDIDPTDAQIFYAMGQYADSITRSTNGGGSVSDFADGLPTDSACFNLHFMVHPGTPATLLASCKSLWRITSPTGTWAPIFTPVNQSVVRSAVDASIDLYYAGTSSGRLFAGPGGASFQQVFAHPASSGVSDIRVDPDDESVVYVTFGGSGAGRVYRLTRSGAAPSTMNARDITADLPLGLAARTLAVDRMARFTVFVGTNQGVYRGVSPDEGTTWHWSAYNQGLPLAIVSSLEVHPVTGLMMAATYGRSAFEVNTDHPIGSLLNAQGRVTFLRVHDVGTGFGPPTDFIDGEVVIRLDTLPGRGFGFRLRADGDEAVGRGMLDLLRVAFERQSRVSIDYIRTGLRNGRILRVVDLP